MNAIHITDNYLLQPANPVTVAVIGAGGTGSNMLMALAKMNHALIALGHPGLHVTLYDDDVVTEANLGRQLFFEAELGRYKAQALTDRVNRAMGTNWKSDTSKFAKKELRHFSNDGRANLFITCVDNVAARLEVAEILKGFGSEKGHNRDKVLYWMDLGNGRDNGQAILSTIVPVKQPESEKFTTVANLRMVTDEFAELLAQSEQADDTPSCSLAEALTKQDLFINPALANLGASLLWQLFREGMLFNRGFFMNLRDFRVQPLKVA